jgi:hypothetical protein
VEVGHEGLFDLGEGEVFAISGTGDVSMKEENRDAWMDGYRKPWFASAFSPGQGPRSSGLPLM